MRNFRRATLALSVGWSALALAGCGGGGSRPQPAPPPPPVAAPAPAPTATPTPPPPPPPPTTTATNFNDAEYRRSNGATSSGAISAWDRGATGGNVTIGVVDSGINPNLSDFAGKVHSGSRDLVGNRGVTDSDGHGTAVSAVAAAARNGEGTMGVAFGSQILSLNAQDPNNCNDKDGCLFPDSAIAAGIDSARTNGARVINLSLGGDGVSSRVIAAIQRAAASGIVIVVSAGNDGHTNPSAFASQIAAAAGANVIIAGSVGVAGADGTDLTQMSTFSNLAGGSGQNYLAALGFRVTAPDQNGRLMSWNGTSFSAPVISGAAALLASAFPHLTGAQIVEILMGSADDLGQAGIDSVYGRGRLNITRAFEPQGQVQAAGHAAGVVSTSSNGQFSGTMGDAEPLTDGVIVLDRYDRAYSLDMGQTVERARDQRRLVGGLQQGISSHVSTVGPVAFSLTVRRDVAGNYSVGAEEALLDRNEAQRARVLAGTAITRLAPRTAIAIGLSESSDILSSRLDDAREHSFLIAREAARETGFDRREPTSVGVRHDVDGITMIATAERGEVAADLRSAFSTDRGYNQASVRAATGLGPATASLGLTALHEEGTVLGGRFGFAPAGATSYFLDAGLSYHAGHWGAQARLRNGWTVLPGGTDLVRGGSLKSDSWSLDLWRQNILSNGDQVAFRIAQPLRVRSGGYLLDLPVAYDYTLMQPIYQLTRFSLAPRGREIDFEASYALPLFRGTGSLSANAFLRRDPGHVRAAPDDLGLAVRMNMRF